MRGFKTAAALTVLCAALGACAVDLTPRPQYPAPQVSAPPPPPAAAPAPPPAPAPAAKPDDDAPKAAPSTPVEQSTLPPPPGAKVAPPRRGSALEPRYESPVEVLMFAAASEDASVTVGKGDTLAKIAKAAGVSIDDLAKANNLQAPYRLKPGQKLALPGAEPAQSSAPAKSKAKSAKAKAAKAEPKPVETVTVGKGDTLQKLARKAGLSIDDLAKANGLEPPYRLKIGQKIALGAPAAPDDAAASDSKPARRSAKAPAPASVKVGKGQTLKSIAEDAGVPVAELARLNHLKKPYRVKRGQLIKLPAEAQADESDTAPSSAPRASRSEPPRTVTAGRRDTLQAIAEREGVPVAQLARLNHLKKPYRIKRGQKIKLPGRAAAPGSVSSSYTVRRGDTLYSIARRFHTDPRTLAQANGLDAGARLNAGRRLQLPGSPLDRPLPTAGGRRPDGLPPGLVPYNALPANPPTASAPGLAPPPPASAPLAAPPPGRVQPAPVPYRPTPAPQAAEPPSAADSDVAAAGKGFFLWPVRGQVLSGYGPKAGGQRNDGLDITAPAAEPVRAAAAGEVVYAGNSVPGFGNLVLLRHDGGWVTAYAHLANIDVKMRQTVTQGQEIGQVGMTGGVDQPEVHFEVRYAPSLKDKARPIDPMLVLPAQ